MSDLHHAFTRRTKEIPAAALRDDATCSCAVSLGRLRGLLDEMRVEHQREVGELRKELAAAKDALQDLYDWQNGPPLSSYSWLKGWGNAMAKAEKVLTGAGEPERAAKAVGGEE